MNKPEPTVVKATPPQRVRKLAAHVVVLKAPAAIAADNKVFANFVAVKHKKVTGGGAPTVPVPAMPIFVRQEQNGRKEYTPGTTGYRIWQAACTLQAVTPSTPVRAESVRIALPDINPASVSAGLSHWRKFNGTLRVKSH
jgi:hypothetical protein